MAFTAVSSVCTVAAGAIFLGYRAPNLARPAAVTVTVHILTRPEFMLTLLAGHRPGVGAAFILNRSTCAGDDMLALRLQWRAPSCVAVCRRFIRPDGSDNSQF